jgi:2-methylcitrate dehydratase PrpD
MGDSSERLAQHMVDWPSRAVPREAMEFQTWRVLDNLGCLLAGAQAEGVGTLRALSGQQHPLGESPVFTTGHTASLPQAGFLNSVMARAHDYCDVVSPGIHPGSSEVPVALLCGLTQSCTGEQVVSALAIAHDIGLRLNLACQANGFMYRGFDSNVIALMSSSLLAARLLGLPAVRARHALGFAMNHGVGTFQMYADKTLAVRIAQGTVTSAALQAALMAQAGLDSVINALDGPQGFFACYAPAEVHHNLIWQELGQTFNAPAHLCFKLYPSCGVTLALTDAAFKLREQFGAERYDRHSFAALLEGSEIEAVISPTMMQLCGQPYAEDSDRPTPVDAAFSVQYILASALLRGRSTLLEFSNDAVADPDVVDLARRISMKLGDPDDHFDQCEVRASLGSTRYVLQGKNGRGWPRNPASLSDLVAKFQANIAFAKLDWLEKRCDALIDTVLNLPAAPSLQPLNALLAPPR